MYHHKAPIQAAALAWSNVLAVDKQGHESRELNLIMEP